MKKYEELELEILSFQDDVVRTSITDQSEKTYGGDPYGSDGKLNGLFS